MSHRKSTITLFLAVGMLILSSLIDADMFLHNPRGSNNRLNGNTANRKNNNRMFDSQNNAKGGYNVGDKTASASTSEDTQFNMHYFQSGKRTSSKGLAGRSLLTIEWTNQHGCYDRDLNCNIVLQYRCQDDKNNQKLGHHSMRNGKATDTPYFSKASFTTRANKNWYLNYDSTSFARGLHESWEWYDKCFKRHRNKGLFAADQALQGDTSIYTRQNANGARSGYECAEERDYYPYWHPTDWTDIVVLTDNETMCEYYHEESFNTKTKGECLQYYPSKTDGFQHFSVYNNKIECENNKGYWVEYSNYLEEYPKYQTQKECEDGASSEKLPLIWAIPYRSENIDSFTMTGNSVDSLKRCLVGLEKPDCKKTPHSRSNHLGNGIHVIPLRYTWTIPHFPSKNAQRCILRIRYNISTGDYPPFKTFSNENNDANQGVYSPVQNNPTVKVGQVQLPLQLAINTAQFGRTFQDRSHLFKLMPRPTSVSDYDVIRNLNVRGKRGNIVQAFPAVEYDFVPKRMTIESTSLLHIQWTGSNTNPSGNNGQGTAATDRNNIVEMQDPSLSYPMPSKKPLTMFTNAEIIWSSDPATETNQDLVLSMASSGYYNSMAICEASPKQTALNVLLNNAPASYRGMLLRFAPGEYYYMCTRNNAFSNRSQKGRLVVREVPGKKLAGS